MAELSACQKCRQTDRQTDRQTAFQLYIVEDSWLNLNFKKVLSMPTFIIIILAIISGADPGEGHRGQMTPPSEPCQGSQKMMYWYENNEFKLSFLYFYKIKTI